MLEHVANHLFATWKSKHSKLVIGGDDGSKATVGESTSSNEPIARRWGLNICDCDHLSRGRAEAAAAAEAAAEAAAKAAAKAEAETPGRKQTAHVHSRTCARMYAHNACTHRHTAYTYTPSRLNPGGH